MKKIDKIKRLIVSLTVCLVLFFMNLSAATNTVLANNGEEAGTISPSLLQTCDNAQVMATGEEVGTDQPSLRLWSNNTSFVQGNYVYLYLDLQNVINFAGASLEVHYDAERFEISNAYADSLPDTAYADINTATPGVIKETIIDYNGISADTRLLALILRVRDDAPIGSSRISIAIGDAYDTAFNPLSIAKNVFDLEVVQKATSIPDAFFYTDRSNYYVLRKEDTVTVYLRASDLQGMAAGNFICNYDETLLELISADVGEELKTGTALYAVNTSKPGIVKITYTEDEAISYTPWSTNILVLNFKVKGNVDTFTSIDFSADSLLAADASAINMSKCSTSITLVKLPEEDLNPPFWLSWDGKMTDGRFHVIAHLSGESAVAAGDFTISYNTDTLICHGVEKDPSVPSGTYLVTHSKYENGTVKFSFIDTKGLSKELALVDIEFQVKDHNAESVKIQTSGSGVVDIASKEVTLAYKSLAVNVDQSTVHSFGKWNITKVPLMNESGEETRECTICGHVENREFNREVSGMVVTKKPDKVAYLKGSDTLLLEGGKVKLTFKDGSTEEIDMIPQMISGLDKTHYGSQTLTANFGNYKSTFTCNVIGAAIYQDQIRIRGYGLTIFDNLNIGLNYYVQIPDSVGGCGLKGVLTAVDDVSEHGLYSSSADSDNGKGVTYDFDSIAYIDGIEEDGILYNIYKLTYVVAAAQMSDEIRISIRDEVDTEIAGTGNSVRDYANVILSDTTGLYDEYKEVVKAMLNYGSQAQDYFAYNTANKANSILAETDRLIPAIDQASLQEYASSGYVMSGDAFPKGITYFGSSLILGTDVAIRHYFQIGDDSGSGSGLYSADNYIISRSDSEDILLLQKDNFRNLYYVEISDIKPGDFKDSYTVCVTEVANGSASGSITYSVMSYMYAAYTKGSNGNLQKLMSALCSFNTVTENSCIDSLTSYSFNRDDQMTIEVQGGKITYIVFKPKESGTYVYRSDASGPVWDTYGYLYDSEMNELTRDDDSGGNNNFLLTYHLEKGKKYYFGARYYDSSASGTFTVMLSKN